MTRRKKISLKGKLDLKLNNDCLYSFILIFFNIIIKFLWMSLKKAKLLLEQKKKLNQQLDQEEEEDEQ